MTDQEIRNAILKATYDAGGPMNMLRISEDWGEKKEKVQSIFNHLLKEGLIKSGIMDLGRGRGMVIANEVEITPKGRDEYKRKHKQE